MKVINSHRKARLYYSASMIIKDTPSKIIDIKFIRKLRTLIVQLTNFHLKKNNPS